MPIEQEPFDLPQELDPTRYRHPPELFEDREHEHANGQKEYTPIQDEEVPLIMAKYAVLKTLRLPSEEITLVKIARGEGSRESFMSDIRKLQHSAYKGYEGMTRGDIELTADGLGVYAILFPLDPEKMEKEAAHIEKQFQTSLAG